MVVAVGAAAWLASPPPSALGARVASRLRGKAGQPVAYAEIPAILREAVATTEDERFYRLHGIDAIGVLPALASDVTNLSFAQGSAITEQPATVLYLGGNDHSPWRKLEDAAVAALARAQRCPRRGRTRTLAGPLRACVGA